MDDKLRNQIVRIIELNVCEVGAEGLGNGEIIGADTAADQIMALIEPPMCTVCGQRPAVDVECSECRILIERD